MNLNNSVNSHTDVGLYDSLDSEERNAETNPRELIPPETPTPKKVGEEGIRRLEKSGI